MDRNEVKFVRIKGRVVPIRQKKHEKERKQGAALLGLGLATSGIGGYIAGKNLRKADKYSQMTFDFMEERRGAKLPKGVKDIFDGFKKSRKKLNMASKISKGSRLVGTGLTFVGIERLLRNEKDSGTKEAAKIFGAAVAADMANRSFLKGARIKARVSSGKSLRAGKELFKAFFKVRI